jgi:copper(I)-binding protein
MWSPWLLAAGSPDPGPVEAAAGGAPVDAGFPSPIPDSRTTGIEFRDAWVRATPPFQPNTAAYLTLTNHRDTAIAITGARSSAASKTELHVTKMVDGMMRMEKLGALAVAPGEEVSLAPGGKHLMLLGLAFRPVPGDDITICLQLVTEEEVCTLAEVRKSGNPEPHDHQH